MVKRASPSDAMLLERAADFGRRGPATRRVSPVRQINVLTRDKAAYAEAP
jgi:hypothetical protein